MYEQTNCNPPDLSNWLDNVARAAIDVFQIHDNFSKLERSKSSIWLVSPLVSKLPSAVQGRILRVAGQVLESTNIFSSSKNTSKEENNEDSNESMEQFDKPKLSHQAFLGLILTCLKGQDEQKEGLLTSLNSQLSQFLQSAREVSIWFF